MWHTEIRIMLFFTWLLASLAMPAAAIESSGLIGMLTSQLNINQEQASGGAGAMMEMAKSRLSADQYAELLGASPDLATLPVAAASTATPGNAGGASLSNLLGGASSLIGDSGGTLGQAAQLAQTFNALGLKPELAGQFGQVMLEYVKQTGGETMMDMLAGALSF
jgi:hypothetical protein